MVEITSGRFVAIQLAYTLTLILLLVGLLVTLGLDLLGLFIGSVYSSVFLALALLALQFGPFWAPAFSSKAPNTVVLPLWAAVAIVVLNAQLIAKDGLGQGWDGWLLWQDLRADVGLEGVLQSSLLHWFFFRCFIIEAVGLNLYLFVGLVGVILLLGVRWAHVDARTHSLATIASQRLTLARVRIIARMRRQTRRTNASQLRYRR